MDRNETLGRAMIAGDHPKYHPFTVGRREILSILKHPLSGDGSGAEGRTLDELLGEAWVVFTHSVFDPRIQAALKADDPHGALRQIWSEEMHISDTEGLWEHIEAEKGKDLAGAE